MHCPGTITAFAPDMGHDSSGRLTEKTEYKASGSPHNQSDAQ